MGRPKPPFLIIAPIGAPTKKSIIEVNANAYLSNRLDLCRLIIFSLIKKVFF